MKVKFECYSCICKMLLNLARRAGQNDAERLHVANELFTHLCEASVDSTPPELASGFIGDIFVPISGIDDPMADIKKQSTALGLRLLPKLRQIAENSDDYFETALRLAIGGNIIDYGVNPNFDLNLAEQDILQMLDQPLDLDACRDLQRRMEHADKIFYILDNCGEAVLDRLLLEPFKEKITVGVRGKPILNDVTPQEARESGIDFVPVIGTGDRAPGVSLRRSSPEFLAQMNSSDLIVAKGQGNFESLEGETSHPIYFLFRAKCPVVAEHLGGVELNSLQIQGRNLPKL